MMKYLVPLVAIYLFLAGAQAGAQRSGQSTLETAILFNADHSGLTTGNQSFWSYGGSAELTGTFWRGFGVTADVSGTHSGNTGQGASLSLVTATFGPRYTWSHQRTHVFSEALAGEAFGFDSVFPAKSGAIPSADALALKIGGGIEVDLRSHFALRPVQAAWLRTQLPNANTNVQNSLELVSGVAFRWQ